MTDKKNANKKREKQLLEIFWDMFKYVLSIMVLKDAQI